MANKGQFTKGGVPWNKGVPKRHLPKKMRSTLFQKGHGRLTKTTTKGRRVSPKTEFRKGHIPWNKEKFGVMVAWNRGMRSSEPVRELDHPRYAKWRTKVFKRDNYTCKTCKKSGQKIHADHVKPWCEFPRLRYLVSNGQTLCESCHKQKTRLDLSRYWKNQYAQSRHRNRPASA